MVSEKVSVAVVGLTGALGQDMLKALVASPAVQRPIRAVTRDISAASKKQLPEGITLYEASFDNAAAMKKALDGVDTVIDLTAADLPSKPLVDVAVEAGVKLYLPSEYGCTFKDTKYPNTFKAKKETADYARSRGLKTVQIQTGLFSEWNLTKPYLFGIIPEEKIYKKIEDGNMRMTITFIEDVCRAVVELIQLDPTEIPDELFIEGDTITPNELVELWELYNKDKLTTIQVTKEDIDKEATEADSQPDGGGFEGFANVILATCSIGDIDHSRNNHNNLVNPGEKNFLWKKIEGKNVESYLTGKIPAPF
ncbi:hypothetical protein TRICI_004536 [Trichomonascus ciferrii]|uniref:NmrA-like domain-containing protein n=1 Tax=Trichomonascus ciferrii TaxID=44093 RepID=A0A642V0T4_9ASCO|nr:hypothetical protein TRICI_004536 [Trichomonascus ciferrii]